MLIVLIKTWDAYIIGVCMYHNNIFISIQINAKYACGEHHYTTFSSQYSGPHRNFAIKWKKKTKEGVK